MTIFQKLCCSTTTFAKTLQTKIASGWVPITGQRRGAQAPLHEPNVTMEKFKKEHPKHRWLHFRLISSQNKRLLFRNPSPYLKKMRVPAVHRAGLKNVKHLFGVDRRDASRSFDGVSYRSVCGSYFNSHAQFAPAPRVTWHFAVVLLLVCLGTCSVEPGWFLAFTFPKSGYAHERG